MLLNNKLKSNTKYCQACRNKSVQDPYEHKEISLSTKFFCE